MKTIEEIEKGLPTSYKTVLYGLRENNWDVISIDDDNSDWALDHKWIIQSTRENKGFILVLYFFKYEGLYDETDCVIATQENEAEPSPYYGDISIDFDRKHFQKQFDQFLISIHKLRIST